MGALERQLAQNNWLQHELAARNRDFQTAQSAASISIPWVPPVDVDSKFSLKRTIAELEARARAEPTAKRPRQTWGTPLFTPSAATSNTSSPAFSPCLSVVSRCRHISNCFKRTPCPAPSPIVGADAPLTAPPVLEYWKCALAAAKITSQVKSPPHCIIPPLVVFVGAHSCTYYMWFAIRSFLYRQLADPSTSPVHKTWTTEEWEVKLHNKKSGDLEHKYDDRLLDKDKGSCDCGVPPLDSRFLRKLSLRADGTPIQAADFEAHALQAFICADLELARAKLQFEQTDDIVLDILLWAPQPRSNRIDARRTMFRNSWDHTFAAVPLEKADILARRPWIIQFRDLLQDWPEFAFTGSPPALEAANDDGSDSTYLDSLLAYEQRLLAFYLKTVSNTLGLHPALPRQRPDADTLPELYRHLVSE